MSENEEHLRSILQIGSTPTVDFKASSTTGQDHDDHEDPPHQSALSAHSEPKQNTHSPPSLHSSQATPHTQTKPMEDPHRATYNLDGGGIRRLTPRRNLPKILALRAHTIRHFHRPFQAIRSRLRRSLSPSDVRWSNCDGRDVRILLIIRRIYLRSNFWTYPRVRPILFDLCSKSRRHRSKTRGSRT